MNRRRRIHVPLAGALAAAGWLAAWGPPAAAQQVNISGLWVQGKCGNDGLTPLDCGLAAEPKNPAPGGNISNDPHIEFDNSRIAVTNCNTADLPVGDVSFNVCNNQVALCADIGYDNTQSGNSSFALDYISFEIFKFQQGSNPLDAQSTPPLRTFFVDNPGTIPGGQAGVLLPPVCVIWDGSINMQGQFGKSNGQYGFRATVATNQTGASGNINITQTRAFPGGFTEDGNGNLVDEKPITVDVTDVHIVRSSPTVVGSITGVAAEPYNLTYRLSKDATMYLTISQVPSSGAPYVVRTVVPGLPRVGEGTPSGTLQNGDAWNGRFDNGDLAPPGVYLATLQAFSADQFGPDLSEATTVQLALDTLQITDVRVQPLTDLSTSLAVLSYELTEPATVYVDIYPPGTAFSSLNSVNSLADASPGSALGQAGARKDFGANLNGSPAVPLRHIEEQKDFRKSVISFWDGRDEKGNVLPDGDYTFVLYAALPSQNGYAFGCLPSDVAGFCEPNDKRVWSTNARSGFLSISRGFVTISQVGPASTVIGSSPPVAGLNPFTFSYSLSRDALVNLKIYDSSGSKLVKTLVNNQVRPGGFLNKEVWQDPTDDNGLWVSSGAYLVQLTAADTFFPAKVTTTTALFLANPFRITDIVTTPLLTGSTDVLTLSYQLSQPMQVYWNIYPPGTIVTGSASTWPPCAELDATAGCAQVTLNGSPAKPLITVHGMRPGRLRITEFWDGRDVNGNFVPDGNYIYTLVAQSTTTPQYFAADQETGQLTVARGSIVFPIFNVTPTFPQLFNSSQTISLPPYEIDYSLTRQSSVTIQVLNESTPPSVVKTVITGQVRDANILNKEFWDGRDDQGSFVPQGFYVVRAVADDLATTLASGSTAQITVSVDPLRIYDVAVSPLSPQFGSALIAYQVSETMKTAVKIYRPRTVFDGQGNPTPPESQSLVKVITGVRPARANITEAWDGTDQRLSLVPDGNYLFKIVGSTDIDSIDTMTGDVRPGASLAEDLVIAEVPVVRAGSQDPKADFYANTFVYPNPMDSGGTATFHIYVPLQARVMLKIYNIAGEEVLDQDFGVEAADTCVGDATCHGGYVWAQTNQAGRRVAHGVYFALIREEGTRGEQTLFQTVKKILIR